MNVLSAAVLVIFAVIGVIAFVKNLTCFIFRYKNDSSVMFVAPINKNCEDAELILRSAAAKVRWASKGRRDCVICLDCDMDNETRWICEKICKEYGFVKLMNKNEFWELLNKTDKNQ